MPIGSRVRIGSPYYLHRAPNYSHPRLRRFRVAAIELESMVQRSICARRGRLRAVCRSGWPQRACHPRFIPAIVLKPPAIPARRASETSLWNPGGTTRVPHERMCTHSACILPRIFRKLPNVSSSRSGGSSVRPRAAGPTVRFWRFALKMRVSKSRASMSWERRCCIEATTSEAAGLIFVLLRSSTAAARGGLTPLSMVTKFCAIEVPRFFNQLVDIPSAH